MQLELLCAGILRLNTRMVRRAVISPGSLTSPLMENGIITRSDITGVQFAEISDVNIDTYGYLVDYTVGADPETVWYMIPGNE